MPLYPNYSMCAWSATTLSTGPLLDGTYNCSITCLSASTVYQYRAYAVIDGVPYYGNILSGCTAAMPSSVPLVYTAPPTFVYTNLILVEGNEMCDDCGAPIAEYGLLYTQNSQYATPSRLCYENLPTNVLKSSCCGTISDGATYKRTMNALRPNTMTYYRAFARNVNGNGYGDICAQITDNAVKAVRLIGINYESNVDSAYALDCVNTCEMSVHDCYYASFCWNLSTGSVNIKSARVALYCNAVSVHSCTISVANSNCSGAWNNVMIRNGENWCACICAFAGYPDATACASICLCSITDISGDFCLGSPSERSIIAIH